MDIQSEILSIRAQNNLTSTTQEKRSGELFANAVEKVLPQCSHFSDSDAGLVGVELENSLTERSGKPLDENTRDNFIGIATGICELGKLPFSVQSELGAAQIEVNQDSKALFLLEGIEIGAVLDFFTQVDQVIQEASHDLGAMSLNLGFHPIADMINVPRTNKPKYRIVPEFHDSNRIPSSMRLKEDLGLTTEPDATVAALTNSIQFNLSMPNVPAAIRAMNLMFQMSPSMLALGGNAGIAHSRDTKWSDFRNHVWEMTHRTKSGRRVFLPEEYILSPQDLFRRMARFPLILEPQDPKSALEIATGTNWLAAKLKFLCDSNLKLNKLLLEFRPLSLQQTPEENAAMFLLSLGRLKLGMETDEPLFDDFDTVRVNGELAARQGMDASLITHKWVGSHWENTLLTGDGFREVEIHHASLGLSVTNDMRVSMTRYNEFRHFFESNIGVRNPTERLRANLGSTWESGNGSERSEHIRGVLINSQILR